MDYCIGNDILDIGSHRRRSGFDHNSNNSTSHHQNTIHEIIRPTHFDVPNVSNVGYIYYFFG